MPQGRGGLEVFGRRVGAIVAREDDVRAGDALRVKPEIVGARHAKGELGILQRRTSDDDPRAAGGAKLQRRSFTAERTRGSVPVGPYAQLGDRASTASKSSLAARSASQRKVSTASSDERTDDSRESRCGSILA